MTDTEKLFKSKAMKAARSKFNSGRSRAGGGAFEQAEALSEAKSACYGDTDVWTDWLQDPSNGLGLTGGQIPGCKRLIQGLVDAPERWVWEKIGWHNGLSKMVSVPKASERKAALDTVRARGRTGKITQAGWDDILSASCPSRKLKSSAQREQTQVAEIDRLKKELSDEKRKREKLTKWGKEQLKKIPPIADWTLDDEVREMLGMPRRRQRRA